MADSTNPISLPKANIQTLTVALGRQLRHANPSLAQQVILYLPGQLVPAVTHMLSVALLTRYLSTEEYGFYAYIVAVTTFLQSVFFTWLFSGITRFWAVAVTQQNTESFLKTLLLLLVTTGLILTVGMGLLLITLPQQNPQVLVAALGYFVANVVLNFALALHRARLVAGRWSIIKVAFAVLALGLSVAAIIVFDFGAIGPLIGTAVAGVAVLAVDILRSQSTLVRALKARISPVYVRQLLTYGIPLSLGFVVSNVLAVSDRILLAELTDESSVGIYSAGYGLAQGTFIVLFMLIGLAASPLLIKVFETEGFTGAQRQFKENGELFFLLTVPAVFGMFLIQDELLHLAIGSEFRQGASQVFPLIIIGAYLQGTKTYYLDSVFFVTKRTKQIVVSLLPAAIINVGLNLLLIPRFGYVAAAYTTILGYGIALVTSLILGSWKLRMPVPGSAFAKVVVASLAMTLFVVSVNNVIDLGVIGKVALGTVTYLTLCALLDIQPTRRWLQRISGLSK